MSNARHQPQRLHAVRSNSSAAKRCSGVEAMESATTTDRGSDRHFLARTIRLAQRFTSRLVGLSGRTISPKASTIGVASIWGGILVVSDRGPLKGTSGKRHCAHNESARKTATGSQTKFSLRAFGHFSARLHGILTDQFGHLRGRA